MSKRKEVETGEKRELEEEMGPCLAVWVRGPWGCD